MVSTQSTALPAGKAHDKFTAWAVQNANIRINKVKVAAFRNAGIGIVAMEDIKPGEVLAFTPVSALLTRECFPASVLSYPSSSKPKSPDLGPGASLQNELRTHALIALGLAAKAYKAQQPWQDVWPSYEVFKEGLPLLWDKKDLEFLPASTAAHLSRQRAKFESDFKRVKSLGFTTVNKEDYAYAWATASYKDVSREDCMALCPFIDYFNHCDEGCKVDLSPKGFTVTSDREYKAGEQVFVSYGAHNNDFLWCEYGFILENNKWDEINIDNYILPKLSSAQKSFLENEDFLGGYNFDPRSKFCFRTQVCLRLSLLPTRLLHQAGPTERILKWRRFIEGSDGGEGEQQEVDELLREILIAIKQRAREVLNKLDDGDDDDDEDGEGGRKRLIIARWRQILEMVEGEL